MSDSPLPLPAGGLPDPDGEIGRPPRLGVEEEEVVEVLRSRKHLSLGPRVPAFEEAFAAARSARPTPAPSPAALAGLHIIV